MRNSRKSVKAITITAAVAIFGIGSVFAFNAAGTANTDDNAVVNVVAAGNEDDMKVVSVETQETAKVTLETQDVVTTEAKEVVEAPVVEEKKEAVEAPVAEAPVVETPVVETPAVVETPVVEVAADEPTEPVVEEVIDSTVAEVIALFNQERAALGVAPVTYDSTLTAMAGVRATENAVNDWFVVGEDGKHKRPDGRNASTVAVEFGQAGSFGEIMARGQVATTQVVNDWHNSATHYACMTNAKYTRVGVAVSTGNDGRLYWVAIFMN